MDYYTKYKNEIERQKKIFEDNEATINRLPNHLKPYQEMALKLHQEIIEKLEAKLTDRKTGTHV
ncbi:MAG: hypothetical protein GXW85_04525 [Clostridia bacterium]|nr:hypothetical protein [Clostridia bacterium]